MEILEFVSWLTAIAGPLFYGLAATLSFFFYVKAKKKGFAVIGASFLVSFAGYFLGIAVQSYLLGSSVSAFGLLAAYNFAVFAAVSVLIIVGLVLLYLEIKPKPGLTNG